jgi:hypothetical protein
MTEEKPASRSLLTFANLGDAYERKARYAPAMLSILFLLPLSAAYGGPLLTWLGALATGTGIAAIAAVGLSYLASAMGNWYQQVLWPNWPHDSPTNRPLRPDDSTLSDPEKDALYAAILRLTHYDIKAEAAKGERAKVDSLIEGALSRLRNRLWREPGPQADRVRLHLTDYGFARNFAGLCPFWLTFSALSAAGCWVRYARWGDALSWALVATAVALAAFGLAPLVLPPYVRHRAQDYTKSLYSAILELDGGGS